VLKAVVSHGVVEGAGQRCNAAAQCGRSPACRYLVVDEPDDVELVELLQAETAKRWDEIVGEVGGVVGDGRGLSVRVLSASQPVRWSATVCLSSSQTPARSHSRTWGQGSQCGLTGGVSAAAHGGALPAEAGHVDGEAPGAVFGGGGELRAVRSELYAVRVAAGAPSVGTTAVRAVAHDRLLFGYRPPSRRTRDAAPAVQTVGVATTLRQLLTSPWP
jgi:hypothetical protein